MVYPVVHPFAQGGCAAAGEDAVVAVTAQHFGCTAIVTRDLTGFASSPVPAMHPRELDIDSIHEQIVAAYG